MELVLVHPWPLLLRIWHGRSFNYVKPSQRKILVDLVRSTAHEILTKPLHISEDHYGNMEKTNFEHVNVNRLSSGKTICHQLFWLELTVHSILQTNAKRQKGKWPFKIADSRSCPLWTELKAVLVINTKKKECQRQLFHRKETC